MVRVCQSAVAKRSFLKLYTRQCGLGKCFIAKDAVLGKSKRATPLRQRLPCASVSKWCAAALEKLTANDGV
jgi:hypothetical protein